MPITTPELLTKLLALNSPDQPFVITAQGSQAVATWNIVDAKWITLFGKANMEKDYRLTLNLDETTSRVKFLEEEGYVDWIAGEPESHWGESKKKGVGGSLSSLFGKFRPKEPASFDFDVSKIKGPILQVIRESGWRPKANKGPWQFLHSRLQ